MLRISIFLFLSGCAATLPRDAVSASLPSGEAVKFSVIPSPAPGEYWLTVENSGSAAMTIDRCMKVSYYLERHGRADKWGWNPPCTAKPSPQVLKPGERYSDILWMAHYARGPAELVVNAAVTPLDSDGKRRPTTLALHWTGPVNIW